MFDQNDPFQTYQQEINHGQARLNFELCVVDAKVIEALKGLLDIVKAIATLPAVADHLRGVDFGKLEAALANAHQTSIRVPGIKPPGCEPPPDR